MTDRRTIAPTVAAGLGAAALALRVKRRRDTSIDFRDRVVAITGGSRGLGLVLARELATQGARLAIMARDRAELERAERDLISRGAAVLAFPCDVRAQGEAQGAIERIATHYGRIDVLINNAGVIQVGPIEHMTIEDYQEAMAVHLWGPLYTMLAAVPHMRRQGGGRIVNIASIGGQVAVPHLAPYSASKFALVGLSDAMRAELAKDGIRVTTVCPGLMRTGSHLNAFFKGRQRDEFTAFALAGALPVTSIDARRAARQIIAACRRGDPELTITVQARLLTLATALLPGVTAEAFALVNRFLPAPVAAQENDVKTGWQSQSRWAPSLLTHLSDKATQENNEVETFAGSGSV